MKQYTNLELQRLTEKWGYDRKITINGKIPTQTLKFGEEMGELFEAVNVDQMKDAIGDMVVVLSMIANLNKTSITTCCITIGGQTINDEFRDTHITPGGLLGINYGRLCSTVVREDHDKLDLIIKDFMIILNLLCDNEDFELNDCWNLAYDEIKDRTGTLLENGNFVKDK